MININNKNWTIAGYQLVISQNRTFLPEVVSSDFNNFECILVADDGEEMHYGLIAPSIIEDDMRDYIEQQINTQNG